MFRTILYTATGLALAVFGPAVYYSAPDYWKSVREKWLPAAGQSAPEVADAGDAGPVGDAAMPVEGSSVSNLAEVLRFDVTTDWLFRRWPRVTTGLGYLQLQGYRVPLVTGTAVTDLAGSLTYYFNSQQQVQRITFRGTTGNAQELVQLLTTRYHFTRRLTNNPGIYVYEAAQADEKRMSVLTINAADVVKSNDPCRRFNVDLAMERPAS